MSDLNRKSGATTGKRNMIFHIAIATQVLLLVGSVALTVVLILRAPNDGLYLQAKQVCHLNSGGSEENDHTCLQNWCVNESGWPPEKCQEAVLTRQGYDPVYNKRYLPKCDITDSLNPKLAYAAILLIGGASIIEGGFTIRQFYLLSTRHAKSTNLSMRKIKLSVILIIGIWALLATPLALLGVGEQEVRKNWGLYNVPCTIWIASCAFVCAAILACCAVEVIALATRSKIQDRDSSQQHTIAISTDNEPSAVSLKSVWETLTANAEKFRQTARNPSLTTNIETQPDRPSVHYKAVQVGEDKPSPKSLASHSSVKSTPTLSLNSYGNRQSPSNSHVTSPERIAPKGGREAQGVRQYSSEELYRATEGDAAQNILGMGGCGTVYKGCLTDGTTIAVKKLNAELGCRKSAEGLQQLAVEVETISGIHHRNLVRLVGFSISSTQQVALAYEYMENGSLDDHLRGKRGNGLEWETRKHIAIGAARGLAYLHCDCIPRIVHRDVKAQNLLLDADFTVKVADFGLARMLGANDEHCSTQVMGTYGYLAPDVVHTGHVTEKTDVYSFGVVLLELLTGRKPLAPPATPMEQPVSLVEWSRKQNDDRVDPTSLVDPTLDFVPPREAQAVWAIALECVSYNTGRRPTMDQVLRRLQESLDQRKEGQPMNAFEIDEAPSMLDLNAIAFGSLSTDTFDNLYDGAQE